MPGLNVCGGRGFRRMPLTVPSFPEQPRNVARVNELMALCDRLEAQLTTTQTQSRRLLESTLHQALVAELTAA